MRFGLREICDVVFRPLSQVTLGGITFKAGQPCLFMDTAKTSTLESATTTVYATGGRGNPNLIAWEGEKTMTFTVEDALLSEVSLAMLTGGEMAKVEESKPTYVHSTFDLVASADNTITMPAGVTLEVSNTMPAYAVVLNSAGAVKTYLPKALKTAQNAAPFTPSGASAPVDNAQIVDGSSTAIVLTYVPADEDDEGFKKGDVVRVDCYVKKTTGQIITITPDKFAGYYYIEAETLFRDEETGKDFPAVFVIPRGKIQSNFTFSMAATGDPSTFTFTIDAFPAYTKFDMVEGDELKRVLAAIQVIGDTQAAAGDPHYVTTTTTLDGDTVSPFPAE